jgi:hypothetical protein
MPDRSGNQKGNVLGRSLILIGLLAMIALPAGAERNERVHFGIYTGWSQGLGYSFRWHNSGHYHDDFNLNFHLGAYAQYDLARLFGLQLNVNYQSGVYRWTFAYYNRPFESGTENVGFLSVGLNGILNLKRAKHTQVYLLGGVGVFKGSAHELRDYWIDLRGGMGIKLFFKRDPRAAITVGGSFHRLIQPKKDLYIDDEKADFLRFQVGYEFCPK